VRAGTAAPEEVSEAYSTVTAVEKHMLDALREPGTIYVSFADPKIMIQKPEHTIHLWSFKRGRGENPWFAKKS